MDDYAMYKSCKEGNHVVLPRTADVRRVGHLCYELDMTCMKCGAEINVKLPEINPNRWRMMPNLRATA